MNKKIWLSSPHMGGTELDYIHSAFDGNWIAPLGANVDGFEEDLQNYSGVKHAAALSAGTAAIHLALIILGVESGDDVICQSMTFSATVNPVMYQKATPVLIDSERETWNMDPELLEKAIIERQGLGKNIKAIMPVHLYGMPAKMDEIRIIAEKYDIPIIEDAAEALGSEYRGSKCGSLGDFGILSFNGNKIITTSGGGALLSNNKKFIERSRFLATQARDEAPHYQHSEVGYNYRMSNICAGIGRGQMEILQDRVTQRRVNFEFYKKELSAIPGISILKEPDGSYSNRWLTTILVNPDKTDGITREDIRLSLAEENIESRPLWKPMHMQPVFRNFPSFTNGTAESLFNNGLCLPSGSNLSNDDRILIVKTIKNIFV
jgi:dTDP-4-amino-4,6-dideoxygalactose transaminase